MSEPYCYIINFFVPNTDVVSINRSMGRFLLEPPTPILAYWNYIPLLYCVKSFARSTDLAVRLANYMPTGNFIVAEVNRENINGQLPAAAWEWFYLPVVTQPPLTDRVRLSEMLKLPKD